MQVMTREAQPRRTMDHHVSIGGVRPDGVVFVDIGAGLAVLVNLLDGTKTAAIDGRYAEGLGPFRPIHPNQEIRDRVQSVLDAPGVVSADAVGRADQLTLDGPQWSRQELVDVLHSANLQVDEMLPPEPTMTEDTDFLSQCLTGVVPQLSAAGIMVGDPSLFCAALYLQRTGLMPHGMDAEMATPPAELPPPPAPVDEVPVRPPVEEAPAPEEPDLFSAVPVSNLQFDDEFGPMRGLLEEVEAREAAERAREAAELIPRHISQQHDRMRRQDKLQQVRQAVREWEEALHPRGESGRWTTSGQRQNMAVGTGGSIGKPNKRKMQAADTVGKPNA